MDSRSPWGGSTTRIFTAADLRRPTLILPPVPPPAPPPAKRSGGSTASERRLSSATEPNTQWLKEFVPRSWKPFSSVQPFKRSQIVVAPVSNFVTPGRKHLVHQDGGQGIERGLSRVLRLSRKPPRSPPPRRWPLRPSECARRKRRASPAVPAVRRRGRRGCPRRGWPGAER